MTGVRGHNERERGMSMKAVEAVEKFWALMKTNDFRSAPGRFHPSFARAVNQS